MRRFDLHQFAAQTKSARLIGLMTLMQVLTVLLSGTVIGYLVATLGLVFTKTPDSYPWWRVLLGTAAVVMPVVTLIIVGGAYWKFQQLKEGGKKVAEILHGEKIEDSTSNFKFRQLKNIVEELAVSAGIPVPAVYVMRSETGINALAAGHTLQDAVVVVTSGAIEKLTRDQMQGVIAHEFAHILNGDMAGNMWLLAFTHGNFCVCLTAQMLIEMESPDYNGSDHVCHVLGYVLLPLGVLGAFLALLFTARIKRQGEYLADATAVELTRLPDGLSDALLMIGGNRTQSRVRTGAAFEASHLFFADSGWSFAAIFDAHPPLQQRIIRLKPHWDGYYLFEADDDLGDYHGAYHEVSQLMGITAEAAKPSRKQQFAEQAALPLASVLATQGSLAPSRQPAPLDHADAGNNDELPDWIAEQARWQPEIDSVWIQLVADSQGAAIILAALRLDMLSPEHAADFLSKIPPAIGSSIANVLPGIAKLDDAQKIVLFDRSLAALANAPATTRILLGKFIQLVEQAFGPSTDNHASIAAWAWKRIASGHLHSDPRSGARYGDLLPLLEEVVTLVSCVICADTDSDAAGQYTFIRAMSQAGLDQTTMLPANECTIERLEYALDALSHLSASQRRKLIVACGACLTSNRDINLDEAWIIRAICAGLNYPLPHLLPGQPVTPGA